MGMMIYHLKHYVGLYGTINLKIGKLLGWLGQKDLSGASSS